MVSCDNSGGYINLKIICKKVSPKFAHLEKQSIFATAFRGTYGIKNASKKRSLKLI